jgi:MFS family permease
MFFVLALFAFFSIALPDNILGVAWPSMRMSFDQPLAAMSLVLPFGVAATIVSSSGWTWAVARLGMGRLLTTSVGVSAVALLCCALAPGYWVVVAAAVPAGLSAGAIDSALNAFAARHFGPRQINWMHACYCIGAATSPLVVVAVLDHAAGWRWAYIIVFGLQGMLMFLFLRSAHRWSRAAPALSAGRQRRRRGAARTLLLQPGAVMGVVVVAVETGIESGVGLWSYVYLLQGVQLDPAVAGSIVSGYWVAMVAGRVVLGSIAERLGTWTVLTSASVGLLGATALCLAPARALRAVAILLIGLSAAPIYPLLVLTTGERTTPDHADRLVGLQAAASSLGAVTFPSLLGFALAHDSRAFGPFLIVLAAMSVTALLILRRRSP